MYNESKKSRVAQNTSFSLRWSNILLLGLLITFIVDATTYEASTQIYLHYIAIVMVHTIQQNVEKLGSIKKSRLQFFKMFPDSFTALLGKQHVFLPVKYSFNTSRNVIL